MTPQSTPSYYLSCTIFYFIFCNFLKYRACKCPPCQFPGSKTRKAHHCWFFFPWRHCKQKLTSINKTTKLDAMAFPTCLTLHVPAIFFNQFQYTHCRLPSSFSKWVSWKIKTLIPIPYNQRKPKFWLKLHFTIMKCILSSATLFLKLFTIFVHKTCLTHSSHTSRLLHVHLLHSPNYMWCATTLPSLSRWKYGCLGRGVGWVQQEGLPTVGKLKHGSSLMEGKAWSNRCCTVDVWMGRTLWDAIVIIALPLNYYYPISTSRGTPAM